MWKVPQGALLIAQGRKLGVSLDDILTSDGQDFAYEVLRDFVYAAPATTRLERGFRIRDLQQINHLRQTGSKDIVSLEPELQRRVLQAQEHRRQSRVWMLAVISAIASVLSAGAAWFAVVR